MDPAQARDRLPGLQARRVQAALQAVRDYVTGVSTLIEEE